MTTPQLMNTLNPVPEPKANDGQITLFLVEDEPFLRDILQNKLVKAGFHVVSFEDSEHVSEEAAKQKPHLILLDIVMPKKNGFDVLDELAANEDTSGIPVMILSNLSQESDMQKANEKGAEEYLIKSNYEPAEIILHVKRMLGLPIA